MTEIAFLNVPTVVFRPTQISGCVLDLDPVQIAGLNAGDPVASWSDNSGSGNNVSQSTAAQKPTYQTSVVNGLPIVRYDGTDDNLGLTGIALSTLTYVAVVKLSNIAGGYRAIFGGSGTGAPVFRINQTTGVMGFEKGSIAGIATGATNVGTTNWHVLVCTYSSPNGSLYLDSASATDGTGSSAQTFSNLTRIGTDNSGAYNFAGDMARLVAYNRVLTAGELRQIVNAFGRRYGVVVT